MDHHGTCTTCNRSYPPYTLAQFAIDASRWACPMCGEVMDLAEAQAARPGISQETKEAWIAVGIVAAIIGLFVLADKVDQWAT